ncbi:hypothetical protein B0H13DRAFT_1914770 [Mycena leptocephala]|nr:hypothetical protein B0H13DRAFT_1914770 [Mycena leptocephala]
MTFLKTDSLAELQSKNKALAVFLRCSKRKVTCRFLSGLLTVENGFYQARGKLHDEVLSSGNPGEAISDDLSPNNGFFRGHLNMRGPSSTLATENPSETCLLWIAGGVIYSRHFPEMPSTTECRKHRAGRHDIHHLAWPAMTVSSSDEASGICRLAREKMVDSEWKTVTVRYRTLPPPTRLYYRVFTRFPEGPDQLTFTANPMAEKLQLLAHGRDAERKFGDL